MSKFQLVLLIHAHQPVGNFEKVFESAYAHSYLPFIEVLERHPSIRMGLHYTGSLLEWIERAHPEYFNRIRELVRGGQVEIVGGGFFEPILISIPPEDRRELISVMAEGDHRPAFVTSELREREAIRYFEGVLVLRGSGGLCL